MPNILEKYQRQPKLYIDLPSKGRWYPPNAIAKSEELAVYSMTASDEISTKTPDALFSGNTTVSIIQNCVPEIKNAWEVPSVDIYAILSAIRMASYGDTMNIDSACENCSAENTYAISLQSIIDYFLTQEYIDNCKINDVSFELAPLNYKEFNDINKINFKLQRQIVQVIPTIESEEDQAKELQKIYDQLSELKFKSICTSVTSVEVLGEEENESNYNNILNFLKNSEKEFYNKVESTIIKNNTVWTVPPSDVVCAACEHKYQIDIEIDYSNFFDQR